ncbi:MAG: hypothetical protein OXI30_00565 [Chloroflexota bacterium]|nr:hypothetical protein [Chloroflexota bacterium]
MRENNSAVSKTPMTEYIVDGDKIYPKQAQPPREHSSSSAKPADRPNDLGKSKPPRKDHS